MQEIILFLGGITVGVIGVLFGGSAFIGLALFQFLFPTFTFAQILGNYRMGSLTRGVASTVGTKEHIDVKKNLIILIPFVIASAIGVLAISKLDQSYLAYAVVLAILVSELSPKLAPLINKKRRGVASFILGIYSGLISAGTGLFLFALTRTAYPKKEDIVHAKIQARFIELAGIFLVIGVHVWNGDLIWQVFLPWAGGTMIGGYIGAILLKRFKIGRAHV